VPVGAGQHAPRMASVWVAAVAQAPSLRARELTRIARRGIVTALGSEAGGRDPVYALVVLDGYDAAVANGSVFPIRRNGVVIRGWDGHVRDAPRPGRLPARADLRIGASRTSGAPPPATARHAVRRR
jgi:hypothetical protein